MDKRSLIFVIEMGAFCTIMIFGIVFGPQYPQIFFWGVMAVFATVLATIVKPNCKDTIILVIGMIVLAIAGSIIEKIVSLFFGRDTIINFILCCICMAPLYCPLARHFINMVKKSK